MSKTISTILRRMSTAITPQPVSGRSFNLALLQLSVSTSKSENISNALSQIRKAVKSHPTAKSLDLVVLPECFNSPYGVQHFEQYSETIGFNKNRKYNVASSQSETIKALSEAAKEHSIWLIGGSIPEKDQDGKIYNSCPVFSPKGDLVALHRKVHLFDIDIPGGITFRESETLSAGKDLTIVDTDFGKIGVGICYDIRFPEMCMMAARKGCLAMIYPSAFNTVTGPMHWELLQRGRAVDNQIYVSMCSPARIPGDGYQAWGHTMLVDPSGKVLTELDENPGIAYGEIDTELINKTRRSIPVTVQRRFDVYPDIAA